MNFYVKVVFMKDASIKLNLAPPPPEIIAGEASPPASTLLFLISDMGHALKAEDEGGSGAKTAKRAIIAP